MPAIEWTEEQIRERARRDEEDLILLLAWWRRLARRRDRGVLLKNVDGQLPRAPLDRTIDNLVREITTLSNNLRAGDIDLATWQLMMADTVEMVQLAGGVMAAGGLEQLTPAQSDLVVERTIEQLEYLLAFATGIGAGKVVLDGRFNRRSQMYARAGRGMYHEIETERMEAEGYEEARSVRTARDSCWQCIDEESFGWRDPSSIVKIGNRACLSNCLCYIEYRIVITGAVLNPSGVR